MGFIMNAVGQSKQSLRKEFLYFRNNLTLEERIVKSETIIGYLYELIEKLKPENILVYVNYRSEVITLNLIEELLNNTNICVFAPRVEGEKLTFYQIKCLEDLEDGYQGISEPAKNLKITFEKGMKALVLVPGSVFDRSGNRMGYGKGFYDRFFDRFKEANEDLIKTGLCYECQISSETIAHEEHDVKMDYIISEEGVTIANERIS